MFLHNKYSKWYINLTISRQSRGLNKNKLDGYYEKHHIIPKCMGGSDDKTNLVLLTAREHYLAHWLLTKCVDGYELELACAFWMMANNKNEIVKRNVTSRQFETARVIHAKAKSEKYKNEPIRKREYTKEEKEKMRMNGITLANYNANMTEDEKLRRNANVSAALKGKMPHENSLANLTSDGAYIARGIGREKGIITKQYKTGKKVMFKDEICFPCIAFAAEFAGITAEGMSWRCKNTDEKYADWRFV